MRNRINVVWHGNRTTARFPAYLWDMALVASGKTESQLSQSVGVRVASYEAHGAACSASAVVVSYLAETVFNALRLSPVGFNPDTENGKSENAARF